MNYKNIFKVLYQYKVRYVVAGGVAVALHGFQRFTKDLDLMVDLETENLGNLFDALSKIGFKPKVPVTKEQFVDKKQRAQWQKEKGMIVFSFVTTDPPFDIIDIFIKNIIPFSKVYGRKVDARIEKINISLIAIPDLKKLKEKAGRPQDLIDIAQLSAIEERLKDEG